MFVKQHLVLKSIWNFNEVEFYYSDTCFCLFADVFDLNDIWPKLFHFLVIFDPIWKSRAKLCRLSWGGIWLHLDGSLLAVGVKYAHQAFNNALTPYMVGWLAGTFPSRDMIQKLWSSSGNSAGVFASRAQEMQWKLVSALPRPEPGKIGTLQSHSRPENFI